MKIETYSICGPNFMTKQNHVLGCSGNKCAPLFYIQRPKWIKDDVVWEKICKSIKLELEQGIEIK